MKTLRYLPLITFIALVCCTNPQEDRISSAISHHLSLYPEAHLQDLYKAFFQAEFGAEHIVADTASAGRYLDRELAVPDHSAVLYEPIGADSTFYRVHLRAVQEGRISRDQLFDAFVQGIHTVEIPQIEKWNVIWSGILKTIDGMHLDLPDYDTERASIDSLLSTGSYAMHHSEAFSTEYDPHYRIIRRDLFEKNLLPHLNY